MLLDDGGILSVAWSPAQSGTGIGHRGIGPVPILEADEGLSTFIGYLGGRHGAPRQQHNEAGARDEDLAVRSGRVAELAGMFVAGRDLRIGCNVLWEQSLLVGLLVVLLVVERRSAWSPELGLAARRQRQQ